MSSTGIPKEIKRVAYARTARWIGWGFGEALIPVFIALFSTTFAEAGLFRSVYDIATLLSLPLIGALLDRYSAKTLILVVLLIYPLVGAGYFLAGVTGFAAFIVFARIINGFTWGLEGTSVDTYYRRFVPIGKLSSAFGYIDAIANFGWILAALSGIWLVKVFPIHYLLLMIIPGSLIAYFITLRAPRDPQVPVVSNPFSAFDSYKNTFVRFASWTRQLYMLGALVFFVEILAALASFFLPIFVYLETGSTTQAILIAVVSTIPSLFGYLLGRVSDRFGERIVFSAGLVVVGAFLLVLCFFPGLITTLIAVFAIEIILELFNLTQKSYLTRLSNPALYGEHASMLSSISVLGSIAGPLLLGISFDVVGQSHTFLILAGIAILLLAIFLFSTTRDLPKSP